LTCDVLNELLAMFILSRNGREKNKKLGKKYFTILAKIPNPKIQTKEKKRSSDFVIQGKVIYITEKSQTLIVLS